MAQRPRRVAIVPHTHWDREWYEPFQTFRLRLVDLIDSLVPMLESDSSFSHFQLDGQMSALDDYLEVRPEVEDRIRRLVESGRLSVGPWYTLPDEFLVSGETLVRNLQLGFRKAGELGGAMEVGYLPDMFGHIAQMPQLLRQFGLHDAVVWRGVPGAVDRDVFLWEAPDGSIVRAEYLLEGYGNGAHLPSSTHDLIARIGFFEEAHSGMLTGTMLWMNGTDHLFPNPALGRVVAEAATIQDDYRLEVTSLADYLAEAAVETARDELPTWRGELRSGARANLLMGVASNRVDVKQAAAAAERQLERLAEPLSALFLTPERWPDRLLDEAWLGVIRNAAHDSVCACSVDEVCDAVLHRYHEAIAIGEGLADRALTALAGSLRSSGPMVVNPSARTRSGIVELRIPGEGEEAGMQLVSQRPTEIALPLTRGDAMQAVAAIFDSQLGISSAEITLDDDGVLEVHLHRDPSRQETADPVAVHRAMRSTGNPDPDSPTRVRVTRPPLRRVLCHVESVPGFGWRRWKHAPLPLEPVTAEGDRMENGLVRVEVDRATGTYSYNGLAGLGRLVDGGDTGDTYNYNPPADDLVVDEPREVGVTVLESGPLRSRLRIDATYRWPEQAFGAGRSGERDLEVHTTLELHAGEELLRVTVELDNTCRDHRLRAHLPLPEAATTSRAECAFDVVERGLEAEGGPTERGLPTFPSRRFVQAGGLTVVHEGLLEYELIDIGPEGAGTLALTLLRATGMLSQAPMPYRPLPAGPLLRLHGSQVLGPHELRYALHIGDADPYELADMAFLPLAVIESPGGGDQPDEGSALGVTGAEVSAVVRDGGALVVRVFNPTDDATVVSVPGRRGRLVDLRGRFGETFEDSFPLGPHAIATARLDD